MTPYQWARKFADDGMRVHPVWWTETDIDEAGEFVAEVCACSEGALCKSAGKHPIVSVKESSHLATQIDAWWRMYPNANLGVNTENITVVDVDFRHGGMDSYRLIQPDLPPTLRVKTGGGFHEYYRGEVGKAGGKLAHGIDFKSGPSQQVVGPGSIHASGAEYEIINDVPMALLPTRVSDLSGRRQQLEERPPVVRENLVRRGEGNDALVAAAGFFANHSRTEEELVGHVRAIAWASMEEPATDDRIREIAHHRWQNHDGTFVDPALGATLLRGHVDEDGQYIFDSQDNLRAIFDGTYKPPSPEVLTLDDQSRSLLYRRAINTIFGEDSIGKTWIGLAAAKEQLARGKVVVHLDWDDSFETCAYRLMLLGASEQQIRDRYHHKTSPGDVRQTSGAILAVGADLIIVDVVANAVAAAGLSEDRAKEYLEWAEQTAIAWARAGACVVLNDHVTKGDGWKGSARGSGAKRAGVDGAAYEVRADEMLLPGEGGKLRLRLQKDRHGGVGIRRGEDAGLLKFDSSLALEIVEAPPAEEQVDGSVGLRFALQTGGAADGFTLRDATDLTGVSETTAQRHVARLVERGEAEKIREREGRTAGAWRLLPSPPTH